MAGPFKQILLDLNDPARLRCCPGAASAAADKAHTGSFLGLAEINNATPDPHGQNPQHQHADELDVPTSREGPPPRSPRPSRAVEINQVVPELTAPSLVATLAGGASMIPRTFLSFDFHTFAAVGGGPRSRARTPSTKS